MTTDKLDIEQDLNYDRKYKAFGRAKLDMPGMLPNIYFIATPMKFEESGSKTTNFTFGDTAFNVTLPFDTSVQLNHYDIALYYSLSFLSEGSAGKLNADIGLNARIVDFKAEVTRTEAITGTAIVERNLPFLCRWFISDSKLTPPTCLLWKVSSGVSHTTQTIIMILLEE